MAHVEEEEAKEVIDELTAKLHLLCKVFVDVKEQNSSMTENQLLVHITKIHFTSQELLKWQLL